MRQRLEPESELTREAVPLQDLVRDLQEEQRRRWMMDEPVLAEDLLHQNPRVASSPEHAVDLIFSEFLLREERGEAPGIEEYAARFPEHADTLRMQILIDREFSNGLRELGSAHPPEVRPIAPGSLPGFEILGEIGRGGMGVVYRARQIRLNRQVCIKMIQAVGDSRPDHNERFMVEAEAIARLSHPNIVQIYEVGQHEGRPFLVLELIGGGKLSQRVMGRPQSERTSAQWVETVARAVGYLHDRGVVHRDLKPSNVLFGTDGTPKLTDFGLAKLLDSDSHPTRSDSLIGTPCYMAPEQARSDGTEIGPGADIYSLGAILYELLTGRPPFQAETSWQTIEQVINAEPLPPRQLRPHLSRDLETICLKCLEKDPRRRYLTAVELAEDLRLFLAGQPIKARALGHAEQLGRRIRRSPVIAAMATALVIITLTGFATTLWNLRNAELAREEARLQAEALKHQSLRTRQAAEEATRERERAEANARAAEGLRQEAEREAEQARTQKQLAEHNLATASQNLYESRINRAYLEWANDNPYAGMLALGDCLEAGQPTSIFGWEWFYLHKLFHCYVNYKPRNGDFWVSAVQFAPDGRQLLTVSGGNPFYQTSGEPKGATLKIWAPNKANEPKFTISGHSHLITSLAQHPTEPLAVSGSLDDSVILVDRSNGKAIWRVETHLGGIIQVGFGRHGSRIVAVGRDAIGILDARDGKFLDRLTLPDGKITSAAFTPGSETLACATSEPAGIHILAPFARRTLRRIRSGEIAAMALSPDGRHLATSEAHFEDPVIVWDLRNGSRVRELTFDGKINALAFSPDGRHLATGGAEPVIRIWDLASRELPVDFRGPTATIRALAFSPDNMKIAAGLQNGDTLMFDCTTDHRSVPYASSGYYLDALAFDPKGFVFYSAGANVGSALKEWSMPRRQIEQARDIDLIRDIRGLNQLAAFSADSTTLLGIAGNRHEVKVWDVASGRERRVFSDHKLNVRAVALRPDGRVAMSAAWDTSADGRGVESEWFIWDIDSGHILVNGKGEPPPLRAAFHPNKPIMAAFIAEQVVRLVDTEDGHTIRDVEPKARGISNLAFSTDGRLLAVSDQQGEVRLHYLEHPGLEPRKLRASGGPHGLAFSPDNARLAVAGLDKVEFFNTNTGRALMSLPRVGLRRPDEFMFHPRVAFSPDGSRILANQWDGTVNLWTAQLPGPQTMNIIQPRDVAIRDMNYHLREMMASAKNRWWQPFRFHLWQYLKRGTPFMASASGSRKSVPMMQLMPAKPASR